MDASQPEGLRIRLLDLIDATRKLRTAARPAETGTGCVTDARGAALAILAWDGTFLSANRCAAALLGYTNADLIGKHLTDMAPDAVHVALAAELSASAHCEFRSFETMLSGRTGHPTPFLLRLQSIRTEDSRHRALLTLFEEPLALDQRSADAKPHSDAHARDRLVHLSMGQQEERRRLAAELHDGLGQTLTLVKLMAEEALMRLRCGQVDGAAKLLDTTVLRIRETIDDVRRTCAELRPSMLDRLGLPAALGSLCRRVELGAEHLSVTFNCDDDDDEIPEYLKADIFRVAQEALNNTVKHASATEIVVGLARRADGLALTIQDNGIGYASRLLSSEDACASGLGLVGMQHRVESHGGVFSIHSSGSSGTLVSATWPL
ncbi:histidine kinase [Burkholderia mayonis]|uniref:Oxygen sensor histidine kinase NreB n=1 Tax=Burkholderia mayonis TaxID=1385591 RepID=A0A1B4G237_9BURK|nr:histidine kinase [Burkholderia mayonis]AOJ09948.1 histidine kinase [Burkholderia mayonis]KVE58700.1 histidine kinase [Burkholderia mayonis]